MWCLYLIRKALAYAYGLMIQAWADYSCLFFFGGHARAGHVG